MKFPSLVLSVLLAPISAVPAAAQATGDLKIRFEYGGDAAEAKPVNVDKDVAFCGQHGLVDETLIVNTLNKGIKDVILYVYTGRGGSKLKAFDPVNETRTLANESCRFEPRVVIAQTGDTLQVTNPDDVSHNANLNFISNRAQNLMVPSKQEKLIPLTEAEPAPIPVDCNIHPWMKARLVVLDHPFAAVSDENGELTIKGLPAGEKLVFRVNHESGRFSKAKIEVNGEKQTWKRSNFEVKINPGMNDLGTAVIPVDAFR